jgi:CheY-like chemotaxis protein
LVIVTPLLVAIGFSDTLPGPLIHAAEKQSSAFPDGRHIRAGTGLPGRGSGRALMRTPIGNGHDRGVSLRVLIVDDNAPFRAAAHALLEAGGFQVAGHAAAGAAAVAQTVVVRPDVVLLDIGLPDVDGFTVCGQLLAALPDVVVVLCSVRDADCYGDAVARSAAVGFLPKSQLSAERLAAILAQSDRR